MADLFDSLFDINRPALNAYITQGQAQAGLRTAQTDEALANAQHAIDENNANASLNQNLYSFFQSQNDPQARQKADMLSSEMIANHGTAEQANAGLIDAQKSGLINVYMNPSTDPQTRQLAGNIIMGKTQDPYQVVGNQLVPALQAPPAPGSGQQPTVYQTPMSTAQENNLNANAGLHNVQAQNGGHTQVVQMTPQQISLRAHLVATGQLPMPASYEWTRNPQQAAEVIQQATQENPDLSAALQPTVQATVKDFSGGGRNGQRLIGYGTADNILSMMPQLVDALNNGQFTPANAVVQQFSKLTGSAAPTNMQLVPQYLATEVYRALSGNQIGTGEERDQLQKAWGTANSPQQLLQAMQQTRQVLNEGEAQLRNSYLAGTYGMAGQGWVPSFDAILRGHVQSGLSAGNNPPPPAAAPSGGAPPGQAPAPQYSEGAIARNPQTGARIIFRGGQWQPLQ